MKPYRKRPLVIQALKVSDYDLDELIAILGEEGAAIRVDMMDRELYLRTLEGEVSINTNEYVIKGIKGEFYTCRADIFEETYESQTGS